MNSKRKVLYVTTRLFWPPDSGRKVTLFNYCKGMSEQLGYDVHLYSFLEGDQIPEMAAEKPSFISSVTIAKPIKLADKAYNAIKALIDRSLPLQCCLFINKGNQEALRKLVKELDPDVVIIDMVRLAPYINCLEDLDNATIINFDDLLSKRYLRQQNESGGNILGKYSTSASSFLARFVNGPLKNTVLKHEAKRTALAEDKYGKIADSCLFVSPIEANEFDNRIHEKKSFSATMGANISSHIDCRAGKKYDVAFVGNMYTSANQDSLRYLIDKVMPLLPEKTLRVIGVCPEELQKRYGGDEFISFTGSVESIDVHLKQCTVLLAPFADGTGIKTKVLEAMGLGIPVVTNSIGLEGITARKGTDVLCAETPTEFADAAMKLLTDVALRQRVSLNGRSYVLKNHTWEKSICDLGECLDYSINAAQYRGGDVSANPSR